MNHPDLYSMMRQIHDAIERDLHRHIMMDRSSSGLSPTIEIVEPDIPFLYSEGLIMEDDSDIRLRNNVMFSHETIWRVIIYEDNNHIDNMCCCIYHRNVCNQNRYNGL